MFSKLCLFLALVTPLVSALTVSISGSPTSGGPITIQWTSAAGDPDTFSVFLINDAFHNYYAIANNVDPALQQLTLTLPVVPVGDYTLVATDIGNVNNIYSSTPTFSIGATLSGSLSSTTTGSVSISSVSTRSTSTIRSSSLIIKTSISSATPNATPSSTTDTSSSLPTVGTSSSGVSRRLDFKIGRIAAAVFAIGGVTILAL